MKPANIKLEIRRPGKESKFFDIEYGVLLIGSEKTCNIYLPDPSIELRHAVLTITTSEISVEDLDSSTGVFLNGKKIKKRAIIHPGDEVKIGQFVFIFHLDNQISDASLSTAKICEKTVHEEPVLDQRPSISKMAKDTTFSQDTLERQKFEIELETRRIIKQQIHNELVKRLDIKKLTVARIDKTELSNRAKQTIKEIIAEVKDKFPPSIDPEKIGKEVYDEALGLGPLEEYLADPEITEIMVNGYKQLYVEKNGRLYRCPQAFMDDSSVLAIIERIVSPIGRRIDESQPYVDARLPDGSRVNAIIPPLSLVGPVLTIRKFSKEPFTDEALVKLDTWPKEFCEFLKICVLMRKNIIVSGGTGSGKTTLLNVLSSYLPENERIITIEDAAELKLNQEHVVRLEARPPNIEGKGAITIRDLVRNSLRMRPDRIVVGECRGGEALDMLQAMNTGHDGSLTTIHANSPRDVISRLETMVLMSGMDLPVRAIREQIASAIDLIVHLARFSDGSRKVVKISQIVGLEADRVTMQDIFEFVQIGIGENGKILGYFKATGAVPTFIEDVSAFGLTIDRRIFDPQYWKEKYHHDI